MRSLVMGADGFLARHPVARLRRQMMAGGETDRHSSKTGSRMTSPVRAVLGAAFDTLPAAHRTFYDAAGTTVFTGTAQVWRSRNPVAGVLSTIAGLPAAGQDVPLTLTVRRGAGTEAWTRCFGRRRYTSSFAAADELLIERMGLLTIIFRLEIVEGRLHLNLIGVHVLGVALPAWLRPTCHAVEATDDAAITFDIPISMPGFGPVIHYRGRLLPTGRH